MFIFASEEEKLWKYRNQIQEIQEENTYDLQMTLTKYFSVLVSVSQYLPLGVDLFILASAVSRIELEQIRRILQKQEWAGLVGWKDDKCICEYYAEGKLYERVCIPVHSDEELHHILKGVCDRIIQKYTPAPK